MAQELELYVTMAEIAGVFVGFGALISVTRRSQIELTQLSQIRAVVTIGLVTMVAGLIPAGLDRYGVSGRRLWFSAGLAFLLLNWVVIALSLRRPESRQQVVSQARTGALKAAFFWLALELPVQVPLILTVLGVRPDLDPAFYLTALMFNLFEAAFVLAQLVYSEVRQ